MSDVFDEVNFDASNYDNIFLNDYIFFDIETVSKYSDFDMLSERSQKAWMRSAKTAYKSLCFDVNGDEYPDSGQRSFYIKGCLMAEYNKVVAISVGRIIDGVPKIKALTLNDGSEEDIIRMFAKGVESNSAFSLVGYNIIGFDIPILVKKMLYYNIPIPHQMRIDIKKPWELSDVIKDIFVFWKFNRFDYYPSFDVVCDFMGIETPKKDMNGSEVNDYYYKEINGLSQEERIDLIGKYCNNDVNAVIEAFLWLKERNIY